MSPGKESVNRKLREMFGNAGNGPYIAPEPLDDLQYAIERAQEYTMNLRSAGLNLRSVGLFAYMDNLARFSSDAAYLLGCVNVPAPVSDKLPPMHCVKCSYYNDYVGPEHLVNGVYTCRSCR